jgi:hypothetical protein
MSKAKIYIAPSKRGQLHRDLGVAAGHHIPMSKLMQAKRSRDPAIRKRANFAINFGHHGEK